MIYTITINPALDVTVDIPAFDFNGVVRPTRKAAQAGGKGFNVSRVLNLLGVSNVALGLLGGETGRRIETELRAEGITASIFEIEGETRSNTVFRDGSGKYLKINETGPVVSVDEWNAFKQKLSGLLKPDDFWVLSGSLPQGLPSAVYAELCQMIHDRGSKVLLDASGISFQEGLQAILDVIKLNQFEAWEIIGKECSYEDTLDYFHQLGIHMVCLSLGKEGLLLSCDGQRHQIAAPKIQEKNAVGAGDAAVGGLLFGIEKKLPLSEIAAWAVASGTAAAASELNQFSSFSDVEAIYHQIQGSR